MNKILICCVFLCLFSAFWGLSAFAQNSTISPATAVTATTNTTVTYSLDSTMLRKKNLKDLEAEANSLKSLIKAIETKKDYLNSDRNEREKATELGWFTSAEAELEKARARLEEIENQIMLIQ